MCFYKYLMIIILILDKNIFIIIEKALLKIGYCYLYKRIDFNE
jgi:hypothetical protein